MPDLNPPDRIVYAVEGMDRVSIRRDIAYRLDGEAQLRMDVYSPPDLQPGARLPAVFFIHGGPIPPQMQPKDSGVFHSYGELAAASGCVGVTFNHRLYGLSDYPIAEADVTEAVRHVRTHADELGVDPDRVVLWAFSGGGPLLSWALAERPPFIRSLLAFYAILDLRHLVPPGADAATVERAKKLSPAAHLSAARVPLFVARAGRDQPMINASVDLFIREAIAANAELDFANHAEGMHGFDFLDDGHRSRQIIARAMAFVQSTAAR